MRILHIINDLNTGGAENQLLKLLANLPKEFDLHVLALDQNGLVGEKISQLGISVKEFRIKQNPTNVFKYFQLIGWIKRLKPDIVHTWMYHSNLIGGILSRFAGVKHIVWSLHHNDLSTKLNRKSTVFVAKIGGVLSYYIPSSIVCVSNSVLENHKNFGYYDRKMIVIDNGVCTSEFQKVDNSKLELLKELNVDSSTMLIGLFARFDPIKNIDGFLNSCSVLINEMSVKDIRIIMAGTNMNYNNIELVSIIDKYSLSEYVDLLNTRGDMPFLLSAMDVVVNPSFRESFSLILAEAMACETPCITSFEGDPSSIILDQNFSFSSSDTRLMAQKIQFLLNLDDMDRGNIGKLSRLKIIENFEISLTTKKYLSLYRKLINVQTKQK